MFLQWFRNRFDIKQETPPRPKAKDPYLSQYTVFGMHQYRTAEEDSTVYYVDETRGIRKKLVDKWGKIQNFPGFCKEDCWVQAVTPDALKPQIRFRTDFEKRGDRFIMLWQLQPDGRYWEDEDGFGAEKDQEVILYAWVTETGDFDGPFRVYRVADTSYFKE